MKAVIITLYGGIMKIEIYKPHNTRHEQMLERFYDEVEVENNDSMYSLGYSRRKDAMMTFVIMDHRIVNLSYVHDLSDYYPDTYRIFTRTATLPNYRGNGFPRQRSMVSAAGLAIHTAQLQIDHALMNGAKNVVFSTNAEGGMESSRRLGDFIKKIESIDPRFSFFDRKEIYDVEQDVWKVHYRDLINARHPI